MQTMQVAGAAVVSMAVALSACTGTCRSTDCLNAETGCSSQLAGMHGRSLQIETARCNRDRLPQIQVPTDTGSTDTGATDTTSRK